METVIVTLVCVALIVVGGMTMSQGFMASADNLALAKEQMAERQGEVLRTGLAEVDVSNPFWQLSQLELTLRNSGQTKLKDFSKWDVVVQYYDIGYVYHVVYLAYTSGALGDNQWRVNGLYLDAGDDDEEVFEPGILNFGEEIVIEARLSPSVRRYTAGQAVISTANGVPVTINFTGGEW